MKSLFALSLVVVLAISALSAQPRIDRVIDASWRFTRENPAGAESTGFSDRHWENISLPHTWNALDGQDGGNDYYRGTGWYRKNFKAEAAWRGKSVFLKFDAAATVAHVFVNGKPAGRHAGNFGAFCFDVSPLVRFGSDNLIAVKVNNARDTTVAPLRGDFTVYGGIYRSVHLLVLDQLSISPLDHASSGVYVQQVQVDSSAAKLSVTTVLRNATSGDRAATLRCTIRDAAGRTVVSTQSAATVTAGGVAQATQNLTVTGPHLWNGLRDPYLYSILVEMLDGAKVTDRVVQPLGLRFFRVDAEQGFFLNGRPYRLNGVNRHQDRENKGWAISAQDHEQDFALIREIGASAVRLAHYQHAQEFYDLCDRGGMAVWAELALVDDINPAPAFAANCKEQLTELIKQNYNHPSIFFWSIFNELMPDADRALYGSVVSDLHALAKGLDPTRLTTMASRSKYNGKEYINTVSDIAGYNVYRGWYEGKPEAFASWVDTLHGRNPGRALCISEYGAGGSIFQHEQPPKKPNTKGPWHPEEWQSVLHEVTWEAMAQRAYLWGTFVWNMFDFGSDGRTEGDRHGRNDKGLVTYDRKVRKDAFFWYKANWNPEPMVHITSKRYTPRPAGPAEVKVYANCDSVSLLVNGRAAGTLKSAGKAFVWNEVALVAGSNRVEAIGFRNGRKLKDVCTWVGTSGKPE